MTTHPVILFDGECNFCNGAVQFIIRRDPQGVFKFASLQSEAGRALLPAGFDADSIVVVEGGKVLVYSDAALRVAAGLSWPWSMGRFGRVIPRGVRDGLYRWFARNRYRWFGKSAACMVPTAEVRARFLQQ